MGTKTQKLSNVVDQIVEWQSVFTGDGSTGLTAVAGRGYFIDTTSGTVTVTLPASPKQGDIVQLKDYARTWGTNAVTISSTTFDGNSNNPSFSTNGQTVTLVYMDGTKGWSLINEDTTTDIGTAFISATGGTVTESGDYKIHTFTGDGCFVVSCGGNAGGSNTVDYLVVAGGGSGGNGYYAGGGGGAGGYRESSGAASGCYTRSPLGACVSGITVSATTYPITVGGGAGSTTPNSVGTAGSNSIFSTITSAGGGAGGAALNTGSNAGGNGGSGGGAGAFGCETGGTGNTPPVAPPQGNNGGNSGSFGGTASKGGGGGGATSAGTAATTPPCSAAGPGGNGATSSINGTPTTRAGGGGGSTDVGGPQGTGGPGGGGNGDNGASATAGSANTGSGGGGGKGSGGAGGKGIVILRYKFQ